MRWITSSGMSLHGLNGSGSVVSMTGHLIDVVTLVMGMSSAWTSGRLAGSACQTTITAATSAQSAESRRSLATITPPAFVAARSRLLSDPARGV